MNKNKKKIKRFLIIVHFVFLTGILFSNPVYAQTASFYVSPAKGNYQVGDVFSIAVFISTEGQAINAAQTIIYFSSDKLDVLSVSKQNSIFSLWVQEPVFSNQKGTISFGGGLPSPGFSGRSGKIITISFKAKAEGEAKVWFGQEKILANDAWGTDIFSQSLGGVYFIGPEKEVPEKEIPEVVTQVPAIPRVSSPTHPISSRWYSNSNPKFQWMIAEDIIGVSTAFNQEPIFDPGNVSTGVFSAQCFEQVEDGIWYFHVKLKNSAGWGESAHFKVQIDTTPPHHFEIVIDNQGDFANPTPVLYFETKDDMSGVDYYKVEIGEGDSFKVTQVQINPLHLSYQAPGIRDIEIAATDKAGNQTLSVSELIIESIPVPKITVCPEVFFAGEETLYIAGTVSSSTDVIVFFTKENNLVKKWDVLGDEKGNWSLKDDSLFKSGIYVVSARARDKRGAISNSSNECIVKVILEGISIGKWVITYGTLNFLVLIILILLLMLIIYLFRKASKRQKRLDRETKDLKRKFYKEYIELKKEIKNQIELFEKSKEGKVLTNEEEKRHKDLLKELADVEEVIKEELRDIEEID